jgi:hypothetical protein
MGSVINNFNPTVIIQGSGLDPRQLTSAVETALNNVSRKQGRAIGV